TARDAQAHSTFLTTLLIDHPRLVLEIVAEPGLTAWRITDLEGRYRPNVLYSTIAAYLPGATIQQVDPTEVKARRFPFYRQLLTFGLSNEYAAPIPFLADLDFDPLKVLAQRLAHLDPALEERITYQVFVMTPSVEAQNRGGQRLREGLVKPTSGFYRKDDPLSAFDRSLLDAKMASTLYHCFIAITLESRDEARLAELAIIGRDLQLVSTPRHNGLLLVGSKALKRAVQNAAEDSVAWFEMLLTALVQSGAPHWRDLLCVLSPGEVATLWHLPDETFTAPTIVWAGTDVPRAVTEPGAGAVILGDGSLAGQRVPLYLAEHDRDTHHYVVGKTKMGKSTLLHNLIHQDIAAGRGVAVIDPHGLLIDNILASSIPPERLADVVPVRCGQADPPVPLNPFRIPEGLSRAAAFNYLYETLHKIYDKIWLDGQSDMVLRNVLAALLHDPDATPRDIRRLFTSADYQREIVGRIEAQDGSTSLSDYWRDFAHKSPGERAKLFSPIEARTNVFLGSALIESMTCHPHTLNLKRLIAERKIVLIHLAGDEIVSEVDSLGAIFFTQFLLASQALGYVPEGAPPRFYLYVDEAHRFATAPVADMYANLRKFGLSLTFSNQYLKQLPSATLDGIFGNEGNLFLFEVGEPDLAALAPKVEPHLPRTTLLNLGAHRMVVKTRAGGATLPAFLANTRPKPGGNAPAAIPPAQLSEYGFLARADAQAWRKARYAPPPQVPDAPPAPETKPKGKKAAKPKPTLDDYE
ncbi:MAG: ATP-binding protein, partial [Anaerolineae bacterium]|nr:ATP-binding protein [Anaerolineae bacterium]